METIQLKLPVLEELNNAIVRTDNILMKKYLNNIEKYSIYKSAARISNIPLGSNFQLFHISRLVYDKKENILEKLTTVFNTMAAYSNCSLITIIKSEGNFIKLYIGTACREIDTDNDLCDVMLRGKQSAMLKSSLLGNFPGTELNLIKVDNSKDDNIKLLNEIFLQAKAISCVNGIPGLRNEKSTAIEEFVQGIEKFIDTMNNKKYTALFIADVIDTEKIEDICSGYEILYSQLSPFLKREQTLNVSYSTSVAEGVIKGITDTTNESLSQTIGYGISSQVSKGVSKGVSFGTSGGVNISSQHSTNESKSLGKNTNYNETSQTGFSQSRSYQDTFNWTLGATKGESLQMSYENRKIKTLLDRIDEQIKRLRSCEDYGVFDFGAYFISDDTNISIAAANTYKSLIRGEHSSVESSSIVTWEDEEVEKVSEYLKKMYHPLFLMRDKLNYREEDLISPTSLVSGKELAIQMGFPKKSISGLPVLECVEFGRDIISYERKNSGNLNIGKIYHMYSETQKNVKLDINTLTSHLFITGSTGAGKSNAIYTILNYLLEIYNEENKVPFLVIEPAKGEYKKTFGSNPKVSIYGTNPNKTELLRLNPFRFPRDIHILEHLDRLIEIFNVCWPMYAAMPAILKEAMERAYIKSGWDLENSINNINPDIYPSFSDVLEQIEIVINQTSYSSDNKGDYIGALSTRLKSLTNGLNGMIFCQDDLSDEELFEKSVIVDLSRIGSVETKSLIMGLIVIRLQEYRLSLNYDSNSRLRHITVLEEAHHLLKRTSTEQSSESANLLGKSVELITNAIAEMRTYGEGFIIADQSPSLLDLAVIKNTNTKIILRLPDFSDRELVGKSANLNDSQINELAKLPRGVSAIYQNDWIQPVLCKIDKCSLKEIDYIKLSTYQSNDEKLKECVYNFITQNASSIRGEFNDIEFSNLIIKSKLSTNLKVNLLDYLNSEDEHQLNSLQNIIYYFFNSKEALMKAKNKASLNEWVKVVSNELIPSLDGVEEKIVDMIVGVILNKYSLENYSYHSLYLAYIESLQLKGEFH